jgi:hypothetical protein
MTRAGSVFLGAAFVFGIATTAVAASWDEAAAGLRAAALTESDAAALVEQARARGLAQSQVVAWSQRLQGLARAGIPATLASERLMQGLTKGIAAHRLDQALNRIENDLLWLNGAIGRRVARAEIRTYPERLLLTLRHGEAALRSGVTRAELERLLGPGPLTLAQAAALARGAATLRNAGVDAAATERALGGLGTAGLRGEELERLEEHFAAGLTRGIPLDEAFAAFESGLRELRRDAALDHGELQRRNELRQEMRETLRSPAGGADMRPGAPGGIGPGSRPGP